MGFSPQQWDRVKQLFHSALEFDPPHRSAFLEQAEHDPVVCNEVLRLLAENENLNGFLSQRLSLEPRLGSVNEHRFTTGEVLADRFRIVRFIAAGGMGEVYEAEDLVLKETLAIKTIRNEVLQQSN